MQHVCGVHVSQQCRPVSLPVLFREHAGTRTFLFSILGVWEVFCGFIWGSCQCMCIFWVREGGGDALPVAQQGAGGRCAAQSKVFAECMSRNNADLGACQFYFKSMQVRFVRFYVLLSGFWLCGVVVLWLVRGLAGACVV